MYEVRDDPARQNSVRKFEGAASLDITGHNGRKHRCAWARGGAARLSFFLFLFFSIFLGGEGDCVGAEEHVCQWVEHHGWCGRRIARVAVGLGALGGKGHAAEISIRRRRMI